GRHQRAAEPAGRIDRVPPALGIVTEIGVRKQPLALVCALALALAANAPWRSLASAEGPQAQDPRQPPKFSGPSSQSLHQLWNDYWEWRLVEEPELATSVGRPHVNDRWRDLSKAARERVRAARQEY